MKKQSVAAVELEIRASTEEFARYREIVDDDWNDRTFHKALQLIWDVIFIPPNQAHSDWIARFKTPKEAKRTISIPKDLMERIRILADVLRDPSIPRIRMEDDILDKASQTLASTNATITALLLQFAFDLSGESGFFRDLQSLLYLNAVHYLVPHLKKSRRTAEFANLVNVLVLHANLIWRDEPSHMFYLLAALMGQLGQKQERLEYLHRALSATPTYDHSYLTKANAYWGELLELGQSERALQWLVGLSRNVPEAYSPEISDMIAETAAMSAAKK